MPVADLQVRQPFAELVTQVQKCDRAEEILYEVSSHHHTGRVAALELILVPCMELLVLTLVRRESQLPSRRNLNDNHIIINKQIKSGNQTDSGADVGDGLSSHRDRRTSV